MALTKVITRFRARKTNKPGTLSFLAGYVSKNKKTIRRVVTVKIESKRRLICNFRQQHQQLLHSCVCMVTCNDGSAPMLDRLNVISLFSISSCTWLYRWHDCNPVTKFLKISTFNWISRNNIDIRKYIARSCIRKIVIRAAKRCFETDWRPLNCLGEDALPITKIAISLEHHANLTSTQI